MLSYEVTACLEARRLLLFVCLKKQTTNANDHKTKLKNFGCTHIFAAPLSQDQGARSAPCQGGPTACRLSAAPSLSYQNPRFLSIPAAEPLRLAPLGTSPSQGEAFLRPHPRLPLSRGAGAQAPERLPPAAAGKGSPLRGAVSRRLTERLPQICNNLSVPAPPVHLPWKGRLFSFLQTTPARDTIGAKGAIR